MYMPPKDNAQWTQPCFVHKPGDIEPPGRAQKRRKTTKPSHHVDSSNKVPFLPLFAGKEDVGFAQLRYEAFHAAWDPLERSLDVKYVPALGIRIRNL